jgi:predicted phosphodiesterase
MSNANNTGGADKRGIENLRGVIPASQIPRRLALWQVALLAAAILVPPAGIAQTPASDAFHFAILGDRTGEAEPGVYERVWQEVAAEHPAFVVSVGDTIQGLNDATADAEWRQVQRILAPFRTYPLYLAPGNHDIWSDLSERGFQKYAGHPPHYSFDYAQAHFTVLDNSRSDELSAEEMAFLERDLEVHKAQPVKFIVSHGPSWLIPVILEDSNFPLHQVAKKYGVRYVIAGHLHQMLHVDLDGVMYLSMASSGGHLRASGKYEDGWFFGDTRVDVRGADVEFRIEELKAPYGQGRITAPLDWGKAGLTKLNAGHPSQVGR